MKKWIKRVAIALLVFILVIPISVMWLFREAFGPKVRNVIINNSNGSKLICNETYSADMAAVFYDVRFTLREINNDVIYLGEMTFSHDDWENDLNYRRYNDWHLLYANSKLLITNLTTKKRLDTLFSPLELRYDNLWKQAHDDFPSWPYSGNSHIDTVTGNGLKVSYNYRIGDYPPFKFYSQTIEYKFDTTIGQISTLKISDRKETRNGS